MAMAMAIFLTLCHSYLPRTRMRTRLTLNRLERIVRDLTNAKDWQKVHDIVEQLCSEYAYAIHQPHARNGGLIGLAAAAIALGPVRQTPVMCFHELLHIIMKHCNPSLTRSSSQLTLFTDVSLDYRSCRDTCLRLCHRFLPASLIRMPGCDTMPARQCTTSPRLQKGRFYYILTTYLINSAR